MLLAYADGNPALLLIGADFLHVAQGAAGDDKRAALEPGVFQLLGPSRKPVAVNGDEGQALLLHLEEGAGVNGAHLIRGDGEDGFVDHILEHMLGQAHGVERVEAGQLGIILRADAEDVELALPAFDGDVVLFVGGNRDDPVRQAADHLAEEPCPDHDGAALDDVGFQRGYDGLLEIVAFDGQLILAADLQTLQRGDGTLGSGGAGGDAAGRLKKIFFAAEFHGCLTSEKFLSQKERKNIFLVKSVVGKIFVEKRLKALRRGDFCC